MQVVDGKANATKDGLQFTVDASDGAILHWDSFSIARGETTSFRLPSAEAAVLNRVVGLNPTEIHGQLLSNGSVYLLNPHGIFVGPEGLIHTGAFLGSTLDCANSDFLEGERLVFTQEGAGTIRNEGRIVTEHGDAILLASAIRNEGAIDAPAGAIALAAGAEMVLLPYGDEKIQIRLQLPSDPRDWESIGIHQAGELHALSIELASDGNLYGYAIKSDGVIEATQTEDKEGSVVLFSEKGFIAHTGKITGDEVHILGEHVRLLEEAKIDVSSPSGGGVVLVGGDYQGKNPEVMNAVSTFVDSQVCIAADALTLGNGGKVILWADELTKFYGRISAQGGRVQGDGGFVEVSGKACLEYCGLTNALAPQGKTGTLLLDPTNVTISAIPPTTGATFSGCGTPPGTYSYSGLTATILNTDLTTALGTCSVIVATTSGSASAGTMTISAPIAWSNSNSLTITSTTTMTISAASAITSSGGGAINFTAGTTFVSSSAISWSGTSTQTSTWASGTTMVFNAGATVTNSTSAGNLILNANSTLTLGADFTNSSTSGNMTLNGAVTTNSVLTVSAGVTVSHSSSGTLTLSNATAGADMTIAGIVSVTSGNLSISLVDDFILNASPAKIDFLSSAGTFTYTTTGGAGSTSTFNGPVTCSGILNWTPSLTLAMNSSLTTSGTGTATIVAGGGVTLAASSTITHGSSGQLSISGTTMTINTPITIPSSSLSLAATAGAFTLTTNITQNAAAGNLSLSATAGMAITTAIANNSTTGTTTISGGTTSFSAASTLTHVSSGLLSVSGTALTISTPVTTPSASMTFAATAGILTINSAITQNAAAGNLSFSSTAAMSLTGNVENNSLTGTTSIIGGSLAGACTIGASGTHFNHTTSSGAITITCTNGAATSDLVIAGALNVTGVDLPIIVSDDVTVNAAPAAVTFTAPGKTFSITTSAASSTITLSGSVTVNGIINWNVPAGNIVINDGITTSGSGTVTISCDGPITSGASSSISHGSSGDINFTSTGATAGDITLSGAIAVTSSNATFFPTDDFTLNAAGTINFSAPLPKLLWLRSGPTTSCTIAGAVTVTGGNMTVDANDDITISVTTGSVNYNVSGGTLMFTSSGGVDPDFIMNGALTVSQGTLGITAFDDITFAAGSTFTYSSPNPITLIAANPTPGTTPSIAWNGTATVSNGALTFSAQNDISFGLGGITTYTSPLPWVMSATTGNITINGTVNLATAASWTMSCGGNLAVNNLARNTSTGNIIAGVTGDVDIGLPLAVLPSQLGSAGGATQLTVGGHLLISAGSVAGASSTLGFTSGGLKGSVNASVAAQLTITADGQQDAAIDSSGAVTLTVLSDLVLLGEQLIGSAGRAMIEGHDTISISAANLLLSGLTGGPSAHIHLFDTGNLTIITQNNITLVDNAFIHNSGPGNLVLVVDQQAPLPPQIGPGELNLFGSSTLFTTGGELRLFTATPAQNMISGTINGASLGQGKSVFGVWYSTFNGEDPPPFTIFYKIGSTSTFGLFSVAIAEMIQEYFDRSMGWEWVSSYWSCDLVERWGREDLLYYRKAFEYPLNEPAPISPCELEESVSSSKQR